MAGNEEKKKKMVGAPAEKSFNRGVVIWVMVITAVFSALLWVLGQRRDSDLDPLSWFEPVQETLKGPGDISPTLKPAQVESARLVRELKTLVATNSGEYAVWVSELNGDNGYGFNEKAIMEGASILKVPAMATVWRKIQRGELTATDSVTLMEIDRAWGSGPLQYQPAGAKLTWERILTEMGKKSDNTGWRLVNRVIGRAEIEAEIERLGMENTNYRDGVYTTTAEDVAEMFINLDEGLHDYLRESIYEDRMSRGVGDGTDVIHKVGTLEDVWADAGIIRCQMSDVRCQIEPFVIVILNKEVKRIEAEAMVPGIARRVWEFELSRRDGR